MEDNKIFVFLSHSHHDYEKVRIIRNILEDQGFRPLMFFLKCLEKKEYEDLMKTLIKEEIDSRQRFILCKSNHSDESDWVKFEIEHIEKTKRPYETVDLNKPVDKWEEAINRFRIRSTVFLSYPSRLVDLAKETNLQLKKCDFKTFFDMEDIFYGENFQNKIFRNLETASYEGYVLVFVDENFSKDSYCYKEASLALKENHLALNNSVIPIWASQNMDCTTLLQTNPDAFLLLGHLQGIDICKMNIIDGSREIVRQLIRLDIKYNQHK